MAEHPSGYNGGYNNRSGDQVASRPEFVVKCSYLEVYMEGVRDLFGEVTNATLAEQQDRLGCSSKALKLAPWNAPQLHKFDTDKLLPVCV